MSQVLSQKQQTAKQPKEPSFLSRTAIVWKTALGSTVAWELARLSGSAHPYLAPVTLILCLQITIGQSLQFAFYRSLGTVVGVLAIALFARDIPVTGWTLGLFLLLSTGLLKLFKVNNQIIHQVALSILFVWYFEHHTPGYAWDRIKDTLIGSLVAVGLVTLVMPPDPTNKAIRSLHKIVDAIANLTEDVGTSLTTGLVVPRNVWQSLDSIEEQLIELGQSVKQAKASHRYNPYANPGQARQLEQKYHRVRHAFVHFSTLMDVMVEFANSSQMETPVREAWHGSLSHIAEALRNWNDDRTDPALPNQLNPEMLVPKSLTQLAPSASSGTEPDFPSISAYEARQMVMAFHQNLLLPENEEQPILHVTTDKRS